MTTTQNAATGYICKQCGKPSPIGVGYAADHAPEGDPADITSCPCGYSRTPAPDMEVWTLDTDGTYLMDIAVSADDGVIADGVARATRALYDPNSRVAGYFVTGQRMTRPCQPSDITAYGAETKACLHCGWMVRLPNPARHAHVLAHVAAR